MKIVPLTAEHKEAMWVCIAELPNRDMCYKPATFEDDDHRGDAYCDKHVPVVHVSFDTPVLPPAPGSITPTAGYKDDVKKLRYDLIPPKALEALAYVYTIGADKYGDDNYLKGMSFRRIIGAAFRHIAAWQTGRTVDPDDGQHPLASVAWCMFTLMEYERLGIGVDDRRS